MKKIAPIALHLTPRAAPAAGAPSTASVSPSAARSSATSAGTAVALHRADRSPRLPADHLDHGEEVVAEVFEDLVVVPALHADDLVDGDLGEAVRSDRRRPGELRAVGHARLHLDLARRPRTPDDVDASRLTIVPGDAQADEVGLGPEPAQAELPGVAADDRDEEQADADGLSACSVCSLHV